MASKTGLRKVVYATFLAVVTLALSASCGDPPPKTVGTAGASGSGAGFPPPPSGQGTGGTAGTRDGGATGGTGGGAAGSGGFAGGGGFGGTGGIGGFGGTGGFGGFGGTGGTGGIHECTGMDQTGTNSIHCFGGDTSFECLCLKNGQVFDSCQAPAATACTFPSCCMF